MSGSSRRLRKPRRRVIDRIAMSVVVLLALGSIRAGAADLANPLAATPLERLSDTRDRPLFAPNRRKPPPVVAAALQHAPPPPPPAPPKLSLYGIVQDGRGARAIVKPAADDKTLG